MIIPILDTNHSNLSHATTLLLIELNLSNNTNLKYLDCHNNQLKELDINKNINLETLDCYNNQLINLDTGKNVKLYIREWNI